MELTLNNKPRFNEADRPERENAIFSKFEWEEFLKNKWMAGIVNDLFYFYQKKYFKFCKETSLLPGIGPRVKKDPVFVN